MLRGYFLMADEDGDNLGWFSLESHLTPWMSDFTTKVAAACPLPSATSKLCWKQLDFTSYKQLGLPDGLGL